jgi:hypothetical protein
MRVSVRRDEEHRLARGKGGGIEEEYLRSNKVKKKCESGKTGGGAYVVSERHAALDRIGRVVEPATSAVLETILTVDPTLSWFAGGSVSGRV